MKFFINTADLDEIREVMSRGTLSGVTTNPSLYARIGGKLVDSERHIVKVCKIYGGPLVSVGSTATTTQEMVEEGKRLTGLAPNVVVKLSIGVESLAAAETLAEDDVAVNVTLVFSAPQALLAVRAGVRYINPFVGRVDNIDSDGVASLEEIVRCIHNYDFGHECGIITASIRSLYHVTATALMGAGIVTAPFGVLKNCVKHLLTAEGPTKFETDWEKVKNTQVSVQV